MHESARISAAIELLGESEASWHKPSPMPADVIAHHYFRSRRFIGSKDRAAIAELYYYCIRHHGALEWRAMQAGVTGARAVVIAALHFNFGVTKEAFAALFDGVQHAPAPLTREERAMIADWQDRTLATEEMPAHVRHNFPAWMEERLRTSLGSGWLAELDALQSEAPVDLRANTLLCQRDQLIAAMKKEGYHLQPTPHSPVGARLTARKPVFTSECFRRGWFEMQDEGSQIVSLLAGAQPGMKVIDFCAGAGGKTLSLAAQMQNKGRLLAWDNSERRLDQMPERLRRAKVDNTQRHLIASEADPFIKRHKDSADVVFVDAPCSGSGTWRRNPDLKWRFTESALRETLDAQQRILASASRLVKKDGRVVYVTCSLLQEENESQIETFLHQQKNFVVVSDDKIWNKFLRPTQQKDGMVRLTPQQDGTDGFFAAVLQRIA